jgi:hypothetical protein
MFALNFLITLPVDVGVFSLWIYQLSLLFGNLTTIETYHERKHKQIMKQRFGIKNYRWPYSFGVLQNIQQVMGRKFWLRLLPVDTNEGDGMTWKLSVKYPSSQEGIVSL